MTLPNDNLELAILLYKNMQNPEIIDGTLKGTTNDSIDFSVVRARLDQDALLITSNEENRFIECHLPANSFFNSITDLLQGTPRRLNPPGRFYLADIDYLFDRTSVDPPPTTVKNYLAAARLYKLLEQVADHLAGVGAVKNLLFFHKEKIEITPDYGPDHLHDLGDLESFESEYLNSNIHRDQKITIIKTALLELFSGYKRLPFSELLIRYDDFLEKVKVGYQLYVAEFSFQKVKAEVDKEKLDAMIKLNKVFSDIQSQLLTIPVALVLVGGQMENKGAFQAKNVLIWLGVLIFAIFMNLLIRNQRHTLNAVKQEIDQQRQQIKDKYPTVNGRFNSIYAEIDTRYDHQTKLIQIVNYLVFGALLLSTYLLLWYSGAVPGPRQLFA